jgi:hypothetical protein
MTGWSRPARSLADDPFELDEPARCRAPTARRRQSPRGESPADSRCDEQMSKFESQASSRWGLVVTMWRSRYRRFRVEHSVKTLVSLSASLAARVERAEQGEGGGRRTRPNPRRDELARVMSRVSLGSTVPGRVDRPGRAPVLPDGPVALPGPPRWAPWGREVVEPALQAAASTAAATIAAKPSSWKPGCEAKQSHQPQPLRRAALCRPGSADQHRGPQSQ